ncbi:MAG: squalene synthase HpnC [Pseudomonadota bacterium]
MSTAAVVETPSGKDETTENFPVGSWLLPAELRPHIAKFYRFARAIDDIADNPELVAKTKVDRLEAMDAAVCGGETYGQRGYETASVLHDSLKETGITTRHCSDLVDAFKQDALKNRYDDWDDLISYCMRSAAPVGRYLLDLHGEDRSGYPYSDALCNALQVINHMQDCKDDFLEMDRVYLPDVWLKQHDTGVAALREDRASWQLRAVIDKCLDGSAELMKTANLLPRRLKNRRLAMESAVIVNIANKLIAELRTRDPLAERVKLSKGQLARCTFSGILGGLIGH